VKDNIDLVILVVGTCFVFSQIVFYIIKKMFPPVVDIRVGSPMAKQIEDLHEWHDHRDSEGKMIWWSERSEREQSKMTMKALQQISESQKELVHALRSMAQTQDHSTYLIKECLEQIRSAAK